MIPPHMYGYLKVGLSALFTSALVYFGALRLAHPETATQPSFSSVRQDPLLEDDVFNATLGFQKLLFINLPERSDNRDAFALQGALSGLDFDFIPGVHGEAVPDKALPPGGGQRLGPASVGSWRGHINALRLVVEQNLGSAIIFEDDIDYDVRIKEQMWDLAQSVLTLTQPLDSNSKYADPTFPVVDPGSQAEGIDFDHFPSTIKPQDSPYGDNWDIIWAGHCGMRRAVVGMPEPWASMAAQIPKGHIIHHNDTTVPERHYLEVYDNPGHPGFRHDFPDHTRVTHHAMDGICSLAYAVSQSGARKLLYEIGVQRYNDAFDIMLRQFCDGLAGHEKHTCLTVQPTLFDHHRPAGRKEKDGEIRKTAETLNIRQSVRMNMGRLLRGETELEDQYPDTKAT